MLPKFLRSEVLPYASVEIVRAEPAPHAEPAPGATRLVRALAARAIAPTDPAAIEEVTAAWYAADCPPQATVFFWIAAAEVRS